MSELWLFFLGEKGEGLLTVNGSSLAAKETLLCEVLEFLTTIRNC